MLPADLPGPAPGRTRAKICGITRQEDAETAVALGADALGFNTWPGTRRFLDLAAAAPWLRELPPFVARVALTVNAPLAEAVRLLHLPFIDAVQLHGDEDERYCEELAAAGGRPFVKALRVRTAADLDRADRYSTPHVLLDAHVPGAYGGTGAQAPLALAATLRQRFPGLHLVLAGGLHAGNVAAAIRAAAPHAVDASSGVELPGHPGRKDASLLAAFLSEVRGAGAVSGG